MVVDLQTERLEVVDVLILQTLGQAGGAGEGAEGGVVVADDGDVVVVRGVEVLVGVGLAVGGQLRAVGGVVDVAVG